MRELSAECECSMAGTCKRFARDMSADDLATCRGENGDKQKDIRRVQWWVAKHRAIRDNAPKPVSQIGTRLAEIIKRDEDAVPCSNCRRAIALLDSMTIEEVEADRENIVEDMESRAWKSARKWWKKVACVADRAAGAGFVRERLNGWLDEAISQSRLQYPTSMDQNQHP